MTCRDLAALCSAYVDGELDDRRASAVRGHARVCEACRNLLADEERVRDTAADLASLDPPAELWAGIEARIAAAEIDDSERPRWWFWWQSVREHALPAAVGAVAVIAVGVWIWQRGADPQPDPAPSLAASADPAAPTDPTAATPPQPAERYDFEAARRAEMERADARYQAVLADLREIHAELAEPGATPGAAATSGDELRIARERALAAARNTSDPADRDAVYGAYQAEIAALRSLAFAGVTR